jgi:hypothetical protein
MRQPELPASPTPQAPAEPTPEPPPVPPSPLERASRMLDPGGRGELASLLPWALAAGLALLLVLESRGSLSPPGRSDFQGPVLILDQDPASGRAVGIPLEVLEPQPGAVYRDRSGTPRQGLMARAPDGTTLVSPSLLAALAGPPRSEAELAAEQRRAEAHARESQETRRLLLWVAGGVLLLAAILAVAWYLLTRRR